MRSCIRIAAILLIGGAVMLGPAQVDAEVLERILAVVNDEIISDQDLQLVMAPVLAQYRTIYSGAEFDEKLKEAREEFLSRVIEEKLVLSEAKRKLVIVKDEEVDELLSDVQNKFPNREFFSKAISEQGLTEKKLWNRLHDQLMTQKLVAYEVKSRVSVSPGEVNDYYKSHSQEFTQDERIKLQHILVRIGARSEEEAKTFAESLYARLEAGGLFDELARQYSEGAEAKEGGEMGWIEKGQLLGEIDNIVFSLNKGQYTHPIKSSLGFHLFKVVDVEKFAVKPLSDVRDQIQDLIFKEKLQVRLAQWMKDLKKNAYISIRQ